MGYTTTFTGVLKFEKELVASQLARLNTILGEDCRDHPEWDAEGLYGIDIELTEDFTGLRWDGMEKTYQMEELVNVVIRLMKLDWPDFNLQGELSAQGESFDDRWRLVIIDGYAVHQDVIIVGEKIICPHCEEEFIIENKDSDS